MKKLRPDLQKLNHRDQGIGKAGSIHKAGTVGPKVVDHVIDLLLPLFFINQITIKDQGVAPVLPPGKADNTRSLSLNLANKKILDIFFAEKKRVVFAMNKITIVVPQGPNHGSDKNGEGPDLLKVHLAPTGVIEDKAKNFPVLRREAYKTLIPVKTGQCGHCGQRTVVFPREHIHIHAPVLANPASSVKNPSLPIMRS